LLWQTKQISDLEAVKKAGVQALAVRFVDPDLRIKFTENQIQKLVLLIEKEDELLEVVNVAKEELVSPLFPRFFIQSFQVELAHQMLQEAVCGLVLFVELPGDREGKTRLAECTPKDSSRWWGGDFPRGRGRANRKIRVQRNNTGDWEVRVSPLILHGSSDLFWMCPQSRNMKVPPRLGWEGVEQAFAVGRELTFEYQFN